jgi:RimJ/RimL family protein N-acetyltransferase
MTAPVLQTERLVLRQYRLEDFPFHAAIWADPRTTRHFAGYAYDEEMCWLRFQCNFGQWQLSGYGYWGIEDKQSQRYIGVAGFFQAKRAMEIPYREAPESGWVIAPDFQGRGLASEALQAAMAWGDAHIEAPESWCMIAPQNTVSQKAAERIGYRRAMDCRYKGAPVMTFRRPRGGQA